MAAMECRQRWLTTACYTTLLVVLLLALAGGAAAAEKKSSADVLGSFVHQGASYTVHKGERGRPYYYNSKTGQSSWDDPRIPPKTAGDRALTLLLFLAPFVLLVLVGVAFFVYMKLYHPDKLKPKSKKARGRSPSRTSSSSGRTAGKQQPAATGAAAAVGMTDKPAAAAAAAPNGAAAAPLEKKKAK